jgi:uncharacterized protein (DUF1697 family)
MARYIALLRGINVGQNSLKMDRLRELLANLGLKNAKTYLQSGNVIFEAPLARDWSARIEKKLVGESRLPVTVILRTAAEWKKTVADNPFLVEPGIDRSKLHVTFLPSIPIAQALTKLAQIKAAPDRFHLSAKELYLHCPEGYGRSKLSNNAIERALSMKTTTRNWNTVLALNELASS